ncbi:MAG: Rpn family recombination-promoting nuclease/putative transposase [Clostridia bacterium]|nr:Rpn family recombination-promoting nuclease/putative transposase [Clostridia bacterium]
MQDKLKVRDSLFSSWFYTSDLAEEHAIDLYEKLTGNVVHTAKKCRLEDVFFDQMRNDVSYEFDDKIVFFVEHQSTVNHNMPFRLLMYVGRVYEMLTNSDKTKKFRKKLFKIPTPEFYVLYNGDEPLDKTELKLSDAFKMSSDSLELKVKVIDINLSALKKNGLDHCKPLYEYSEVIEQIKIRGAVEAIKYCIDNDIVADYIKQFGSEAFNMLFQDYDFEQDKKIYGEECLEEGIEKGIEKERHSTLESVKQLFGLGGKIEDLKRIFHLNDEEVKFVTSM